MTDSTQPKKSAFRYWNIDKWAFIAFFVSSLGVSLYFSQLSSQWKKPIFHEISLEVNAPTISLNYSVDENLLVLKKGNEEPIKLSCMTVEAELCGKGLPYAYNYEVEYINIAQIENVKYIDQITYIENKTNVVELKTTIRNYAEERLKSYDNQKTLYIGFIGILFLAYVAVRYFGFNSSKDEDYK